MVGSRAKGWGGMVLTAGGGLLNGWEGMVLSASRPAYTPSGPKAKPLLARRRRREFWSLSAILLIFEWFLRVSRGSLK